MDYTQGFSSFAVPDLASAETFYTDVLGLQADEEHGMLSITLPGGTKVMVYPKQDHEPAVFTVLNLGVTDLPAAVDELAGRGAEWLRYDSFEQDERGIVAAGDMGPAIAWTSDPAGNVVAVMQIE